MKQHLDSVTYFNQDADENDFYRLDDPEEDTIDTDFLHHIMVIVPNPDSILEVTPPPVDMQNLEVVTRKAARELGLDEETYVKRIKEVVLCQRGKEFIMSILKKHPNGRRKE